MVDDINPATDRAQAVRIARSVLDKLKVDNGVVRAADLVDALNELLDPEDGTEPGLVLPYPSVAREAVGQIVAALRAAEREQGAPAFVPTMEI